MSNDNQYDAPCGHCMTPETYEKHTEKAAYGKTDPKKVRLYELLAGVKSGAHTIKEAYEVILKLGATRTPAPGVEEVVAEFKSLCSDLYDLPYHSTTVVWDRRDTEGIERWLRTLLTTHQQDKEALVREMYQALKYQNTEREMNAESHERMGIRLALEQFMLQLCTKYGLDKEAITSDTLKS